MRTYSFVDDEPPRIATTPYKPEKKKKGIKGFFKKMTGGNKKNRASEPSYIPSQKPPGNGDEDVTGPLAPPPSLSYLVDRVDRPPSHKKSPSNSSLSALAVHPGSAPSSSQISPVTTSQGTPAMNYWSQPRSVSAPMAKSPSKGSLLSTSPTSSRFQVPLGSFSPLEYDDRRRSNATGIVYPIREDASAPDARYQIGQEVVDDGPYVSHRDWSGGSDGMGTTFRGKHGKAPSLQSNSSGTPFPPSVESPGFGPMPHSRGLIVASASTSSFALGAGEKNKTLPLLPPTEGRHRISPDSYHQAQATRGSDLPTGYYPAQEQSLPPSVSSPNKSKSRFGLKTLFSANLGMGQPVSDHHFGRSDSNVDNERYLASMARSRTHDYDQGRDPGRAIRQTYYQ